MKHCLFLFGLCLLGVLSARGVDLPKVRQGKLEHWSAVPSKYVKARAVDVWLPPGYDPKSPCPVLYMHDGQMLFDAESTWNKKAWNLDVTLARLIAEGRLPPLIVVGVYSIGEYRHAEYFPEKALALMEEPLRGELLQKGLGGTPRADAYLRFLVEELKPAIDRSFATKPGPADTAIMGSSMGGIVSLYAFCEYPAVFGLAGCLSTHWPGGFQANASVPLAELRYLQLHLPAPGGRRLYLDHGTVGLDSLYAPTQGLVDVLLKEKGYGPASFTSRVFPGADHSEDDWARRVEQPLLFLFGGGK